jgi:tRNA (guanine-N7-)-methyltransferase
MSNAVIDGSDRMTLADDGAMPHGQGSFFGRRKGHKLRSHQSDLIEHLLPRLSIDIRISASSAASLM